MLMFVDPSFHSGTLYDGSTIFKMNRFPLSPREILNANKKQLLVNSLPSVSCNSNKLRCPDAAWIPHGHTMDTRGSGILHTKNKVSNTIWHYALFIFKYQGIIGDKCPPWNALQFKSSSWVSFVFICPSWKLHKPTQTQSDHHNHWFKFNSFLS